MKVGISTATFFSKLLTEDSFSVIKNCKGETAEVFLTTFFEYEPEFGELLKQRKEGLEVYSVHALNTEFEPQLFNIADRTRLDAEKVYKRVLAVGKQIGATHYTFHGTSRLKKNAYIDPVRFGRRMRELGDISLDYGIKLCFENVHWAAFNTPEFFKDMKNYAPNIGATLDIKQAWQSGRDWREYLDVMGDRLSNVHISDHTQNEIVMVGKGEFPFEQLVKELLERGYVGPLIIEQYAKNYDGFGEVADAVEYMKKLIGGIYATKI
jgi:sugar phosphate isomerase/epimerase